MVGHGSADAVAMQRHEYAMEQQQQYMALIVERSMQCLINQIPLIV